MGCAYTFEKFGIEWDMFDGIYQRDGKAHEACMYQGQVQP